MANAFYPSFKKRLLDADIAHLTDTIKVLLVDSTYVFDASDEFVSDLVGILTGGRSPALASKTTDDGIFDAADPTFPLVPGGQIAEALVFYKDTGLDSTSPLTVFQDENMAGLPFATDGTNITLTFAESLTKAYALLN